MLFVFLVCLSVFDMSHFFLKKANLEDIFCEWVEIYVLSETHTSNARFRQINENRRLNVYAHRFWEPVYKISYS